MGVAGRSVLSGLGAENSRGLGRVQSCTINGVIRWVARIVLFLVLGAAVSVAVAWGCAIARGDPFADARYMRYQGQGYRTRLSAATGFGCAYVEEYPPFERGTLPFVPTKLPLYSGRAWWTTDALPAADSTGNVGCGWPTLALSARVRPTPASVIARERSIVIKGGFVLGNKALNPPRDETLPIILPYRPIWPGFIVNTGAYGGLLLAIFVVPGLIRRWVRRRRGQCPACGYPRGVSAVCSECGAVLPVSPGRAGG